MSTDRVVASVPLDTDPGAGSTAAEITKRNVNAIRATVLGMSRVRRQRGATQVSGPGASSGSTQEIGDDVFSNLEKAGKIVPPPFDLLTLAVMPENSTELGPAIDAMAVNVESFGWTLDPRVTVNERTSLEVLRTLAEERVAAENFFENCCEDGESLEDLREKLRRDLEATGNCYTEFLEIPGTGRLDGLSQLPSWTMRISGRDEHATEYLESRVEKSVRFVEPEPEAPEQDEGDLEARLQERDSTESRVRKQFGFETEVSYEIQEQTRFKRFRRYVQRRGRKAVWFKELGDPRLISSEDGHPVSRKELLATGENWPEIPRFTLRGEALSIEIGTVGFPVRSAANAVRHKRLYSTRSPYGLPRYVGHLFAIFGSRAAEEINFTTFKNNNVPSLAITVANGKLDDGSIERVEEFVEAAIQGDDNYSKFLLLEAEPVMQGMRDPGAMKIEIKPLTKEQHTDALFVTYQNANDERVRRAWRFPPIFVGKSDDFTGKTIEASRKLAEEQVFEPERKKVDRFFTRDVLLRLGVVWSTFRSNSPNVTENADLVKLLAQGEKTGGLTPRIARTLLGRIVNADLGEVDPELLPPDQPFSLTLANIMKTDSASAAPGGGEPTSQGRAGLQVGGETVSESAGDEGEVFVSLAELIRAEAASRFGGFVPPALDLDPEE